MSGSTGSNVPTFSVAAVYDYFTGETPPPVAAPDEYEGDVWDTAVWDGAFWASDLAYPFQEARGANGMGRVMAIATSGRSRGVTTLISWDVMWDTGGFL